MELFARIKCTPTSILNAKVEAIMKRLGLWEFRDTYAHALSGGNKRKLSLAIALSGDPSIIFLDEPSTG